MPDLNIPNLDKLIAHMEALREDQFDMRFVFRSADGRDAGFFVINPAECGTAACIAGECAIVAGVAKGCIWDAIKAGKWLGLDVCFHLFTPNNYERGNDFYPLVRAIATLKRLRDEYLRSGRIVIDWGKEPGEPGWDGEVAQADDRLSWSAPHVSAGLPTELTRFLGEPASVGA